MVQYSLLLREKQLFLSCDDFSSPTFKMWESASPSRPERNNTAKFYVPAAASPQGGGLLPPVGLSSHSSTNPNTRKWDPQLPPGGISCLHPDQERSWKRASLKNLPDPLAAAFSPSPPTETPDLIGVN